MSRSQAVAGSLLIFGIAVPSLFGYYLATAALADPEVPRGDPGWITVLTRPSRSPVQVIARIGSDGQLAVAPQWHDSLDGRPPDVAVVLAGQIRLRERPASTRAIETFDAPCEPVLLGDCGEAEDETAQVYIFAPTASADGNRVYDHLIGQPAGVHVETAAGSYLVRTPFMRALRERPTDRVNTIDVRTLEYGTRKDAFGPPARSQTELLVAGPVGGTAYGLGGDPVDNGEFNALSLDSAEPPLEVPIVRGWGSCLLDDDACPTQRRPRTMVHAGVLRMSDVGEQRAAQLKLLFAGALFGIAASALLELASKFMQGAGKREP